MPMPSANLNRTSMSSRWKGDDEKNCAASNPAVPDDALCDHFSLEREHHRNKPCTGLVKNGSLRPEADIDIEISSGQFGGILCWKEYISSMEKYELALIDCDDDIAAYHHIRRLVLNGGSDEYIPNGPEEVKKENLSLLLKHAGEPIGTVRLDQKADRKAIVRLVAIVSDLQRQGHGTVLMDRVERLAISLGIQELLVHALPSASGFYLKLGYSPFEFEDGNSHSVQLRKLVS
jgi:GNAT superfamily N-acetyltransferase